MKLKLWYLLPGEPKPWTNTNAAYYSEEFIRSMVESNPDTIFFYTTDTTDIFEED